MKSLQPLALKSSLLIFLSMFSSMAFAGPGINLGNMAFHIPAPAAIPTLSSTMLIVLSLLLFAVAFRAAKQKNSGASKLFLTLIGVTALSSGAGGLKLISDVEAGGAIQTVTLNTNLTPTTGQVDLFGPQTNYFDNPYTVDVTIDNITIFPGFSCFSSYLSGKVTAAKDIDPGAPTCSDMAPDNIIPPGGQCQLTCFSDSMDN